MASLSLRRIHRVIAILFLLSIPPAAYASSTGDDPADPSPLVYIPLLPLLLLTLSGSVMLVQPWIRRRKGRAMMPEPIGVSAKP